MIAKKNCLGILAESMRVISAMTGNPPLVNKYLISDHMVSLTKTLHGSKLNDDYFFLQTCQLEHLMVKYYILSKKQFQLAPRFSNCNEAHLPLLNFILNPGIDFLQETSIEITKKDINHWLHVVNG